MANDVGEDGASIVLHSEATPEHLVHVIEAAARGDDCVTPDLPGACMTEIDA